MMLEILNPNPLTCYAYLPEVGMPAIGDDWDCERCVYWNDEDEKGNYKPECHAMQSHKR